jgi:hypothetical protein
VGTNPYLRPLITLDYGGCGSMLLLSSLDWTDG